MKVSGTGDAEAGLAEFAGSDAEVLLSGTVDCAIALAERLGYGRQAQTGCETRIVDQHTL